MTRAAAVASACAVLVGAGCGDAPTGSSLRPPPGAGAQRAQEQRLPSPCRLLPRGVARQLLGKVVGPPRRLALGSARQCTWFSGGDLAVSAGVYRGTAFRESVRTNEAVPVRGLGGEAYYHRRLGALIRLPGRPYYVQVAAFVPSHAYSPRRPTIRAAHVVLSGRPLGGARVSLDRVVRVAGSGAARGFVCRLERSPADVRRG